MKVLLSAYACEPHKGSEPEVGLRTALAAATEHEVWVITRRNNLEPLRAFLSRHPLAERIHLEGLDLEGLPRSLKARVGLAGLHWYYDRWQTAAGDLARRLDRRIGFDLVHHATFASYWTRAGVASVGKPFVWGPVGGGLRAPLLLAGELGLKGLMEEAGRLLLRRLGARISGANRARRAARIVLAQNDETAEILDLPLERRVIVPNAVGVDLEVPRVEHRSPEVALVGRLDPLKGGVLAVRTLRHVRHREAVLRIYGEGPDRRRIQRLAHRWGLGDRVGFEGHLPRAQLLERVATSAALLHPSFHEEAGLAVAEALALGTPVVCLDRGGPRCLLRYWAESPATVVKATTPERTARRMAEALDGYLSHPAPVVPKTVPAVPSYRDVLLGAYRAATTDRSDF